MNGGVSAVGVRGGLSVLNKLAELEFGEFDAVDKAEVDPFEGAYEDGIVSG